MAEIQTERDGKIERERDKMIDDTPKPFVGIKRPSTPTLQHYRIVH